MADFGGDVETFRAEARNWLEANFPKELAKDPDAQLAKMQARPESDAARAWRRAMGEKGWGTPTWPKAYGGGGLSRQEARVLHEEMAKVGARNPIGGMGVMMFGPTLIEYGTEELKRQHLPGIITGEVRWCQGYSEPGAGSDLASLQTRAEDKGDHYLVSGQKVWTSGANLADWCFCLVRTDPSAKKHEGISFLLIDMTSPGVEVRPIRLINGTSPFCETFFTDVRVPKDQLFGPLNGGWTVAKRLLQFERDNISAGLGGGSIGAPVHALTVLDAIKEYAAFEDGRLADGDLRRRVTEHLMEAKAFQLTVRRAADEAKGGAGPSNTASIMKYAGAKLAQDRNELIVEAIGHQGLGWEGEGFRDVELAALRTMLRSKGNSIEGGTSEINLNVVSKRVLGLPDPQKG
ncbi:acyl-CoA dehydrogenase family protein [Phenylobacterium sp.]|jgi:alkylation response protein AidB-like acyl-CoA dehydrogenase|uniref:acyl-CoA dehydrogenase family protein n=1 Tax=Phenylobacterium sp. TaxID=1871053 RepID=UPI002F94D3AD